jgi:hypothetical protein
VFDPPGDRVEVRLVLPDGSLTNGVLKYIEPPDSKEAKEAMLLPAEFRSVTPRAVVRGTAATSIRLTGERLRYVQNVSVRIGSDDWLSLPATERTDTGLTVRLPARLLAKAQFLAIAPRQWEEDAIAFLVADPALPKPGTTSALSIRSISDTEIGPGGFLLIHGSGFAEDAIALLGRDGSIELSTEVMDDSTLSVELPESYIGTATDLWIAVATPDRRAASASIAVVATTTHNWPDYRTFVKDPATIANVIGTLVRKDGNQDLLVDGLGLEPGMEFELTSQGKPRHVRKVATRWDGAPSKDRQLSRVKLTFALDELWPTTGCVSPSRR